MLGNLVKNHEDGDIDCPSCEEQFGFCSCGGAVHAEYQEVFRKLKGTKMAVSQAILVLECDRCDSFEIE